MGKDLEIRSQEDQMKELRMCITYSCVLRNVFLMFMWALETHRTAVANTQRSNKWERSEELLCWLQKAPKK
jgi:hypothetical protein